VTATSAAASTRAGTPIGPRAVTGVSVTATSVTAGATQVLYKVRFTATHALSSSTGFVQLTAPAGTVFSTVSNGFYDVRDGSNHGYSQNEVVSPGGAGNNVVDVYIPTGFSVNAGDTVEVDAYAVANPTTASAGASFAVSTSSDSSLVPVAFPIAAASQVSAVSSTIDSRVAGASGVTYTVRLTATHALNSCEPDDCDSRTAAFIQLSAASGAVFPTPSNTNIYTITDGPSSSTPSNVTVGPDGVGSNVVDAYIPTSFSVNAGDQLVLSITGLPTHPGSATVRLASRPRQMRLPRRQPHRPALRPPRAMSARPCPGPRRRRRPARSPATS